MEKRPGDLKQALWWKHGIIYQVYPRSFQDSNGDGIGDLQGIRSRLPYLQWLGISTIWISPVFPSPMKDFGYDISDYENIDPIFGSMKDIEELLQTADKLNIKIMLDLVPNHTSDLHPWFLASRSGRKNPRRDWFIWADAKPDGAPPNNWLSVFGGSAWSWDEGSGQYYYHAFLKEQPDLNWRNPEVQEAMFGVMRFWLTKGIAGFRIDVLWHLIKDEQLRDNPTNPDYSPAMADYDQLLPVYSTDQPEVHDIVRRMRQVIDEYADRMMIGEIYLPIHKLVTYYGNDNDGANLPFNFLLIALPWNALLIALAIDEYEGALPRQAWPNWVIGNHDQPRITSRVGEQQARIAAMLLLTLRGTPTLYYGDEIGMRDVPIPWTEIRDPQGLNMPGKNLSRDPARTPMQWDAGDNAGFTDKQPWLKVSNEYLRRNVHAQKGNPFAMLTLYQRLIHLRQTEPSLLYGEYTRIHADSQMLVFTRRAAHHPAFLIALNLSHRPCYFRIINRKLRGTVEIAAYPELEGNPLREEINLAGDEGIIVRLT